MTAVAIISDFKGMFVPEISESFDGEIKWFNSRDFIQRFLEKRCSHDKYDYFILHLYAENRSYTKNILYDPYECQITDIIAGIMFRIYNRVDYNYFDSLLNKICFVSQKPAAFFDGCCHPGLTGFQNALLIVPPGGSIGSEDVKVKVSQLALDGDPEEFVNEVGKILQGAFDVHP